VITGEGSDEILAGYLHFGRDAKGGDPATQPSPSLNLNGKQYSLEPFKNHLRFIPNWMESACDITTALHSVQSDAFLESARERDGFRSFFSDLDFAGQLQDRHPLNQSLYLWSKTVLPGYLLTMLGDRMEMAHSVEGRLPFLDHRLVELVRSFPINQKIRNGTHKYILRHSMKDLVTPTVFRRRKQPFWSPPASLDGRFGCLTRDLLCGPALRGMPFFDPQKVSQLLTSWSANRSPDLIKEQALMLTLSACVIQERYRVSA
jgi:asparagine synthase (glutamine-hydrolysing)